MIAQVLLDKKSPYHTEGGIVIDDPNVIGEFRKSIMEDDSIKNTEKVKYFSQMEDDGGLIIGNLGPVKREDDMPSFVPSYAQKEASEDTINRLLKRYAE